MQVRLQKFLASAGVASRRKSENLILQGRVRVNGIVQKILGTKIDTERDRVEVDGKIINSSPLQKIYIMLNKPQKTVSTVFDPQGRKTVLDCIHGINRRIYPVGRLDYDTEGLLLLTDDGEITYNLTHPKHEVEKTYFALVKGFPDENSLDLLRRGILLEDGLTAPAKINLIQKTEQGCWIRISIHEGKKRQVRRMFNHIGHPVIFLKRVKLGELDLKDLKPGEWRYLTAAEIRHLKKMR